MHPNWVFYACRTDPPAAAARTDLLAVYESALCLCMETRIQATCPHGHAGIHTCTCTHSHMPNANRKWELGSGFALGCSCTLGRVWVHLLAVILQWRHPLIISCHVTASLNQLAPRKEKKKKRKGGKKSASQLPLNSDDKNQVLVPPRITKEIPEMSITH